MKTRKADPQCMRVLREAILSAATMLQDVPEGKLPDEDTFDYIDSDVRAAFSVLEDIWDLINKSGSRP